MEKGARRRGAKQEKADINMSIFSRTIVWKWFCKFQYKGKTICFIIENYSVVQYLGNLKQRKDFCRFSEINFKNINMYTIRKSNELIRA